MSSILDIPRPAFQKAMQAHTRWPFFGHAGWPDGPSCVRPVHLHFKEIWGLGIQIFPTNTQPPSLFIKCRCTGLTQKGPPG